MTAQEVILLILGLTGWPLLIALIVVGLDRFDKLCLVFSKIMALFKWAGTGFRKNAIVYEIQSVLIKASKTLSQQNPNIAPYALKIEWVKEKDMETFVQEKRVVVRMSDAKKSERNVVWATTQYAKYGVVPYAKPHMPQTLANALDLTITKILLSSSYNFALPFFYSEMYKLYQKDQKLDTLFHDLIKVDDNGILTRIFLNELAKISDQLLNICPNPSITLELKEFASFLIDIAVKERGKYVKLTFNRSFIKIAIVLAASDFSKDIADKNVQLIERYLSGNCQTVYILALGIKMIMAEHLIDAIEAENRIVCYSKKSKYVHRSIDGSKIDGICIELNTLCQEGVA